MCPGTVATLPVVAPPASIAVAAESVLGSPPVAPADPSDAGTVPGLVASGSPRRESLQDVWMPHLFAKDFFPYKPGKHVEIPPGARGAVLSSNEHPEGPAPTAIRDLLSDGIITLFGHMGMEDRIAEAIRFLGEDGGIFRRLSEASRQYIDDYGPFAELYAGHLDHGLCGAQIYVAAGASQLIYKLIGATNPERGAVMAFMPGFFMYPIGAMAEGRPFHSVFLDNDLGYPLDRFLAEARTVDPGLIFIDTPNNPTGGVVPRDWIEKLIEESLARNGYVVVDEAYFDFIEDRSFTALSLLERYPNVIVLRSCSKYWALAGGRLGFGIAAPDSVAQTLFGRVKTPFEVATSTIELARYSLKPGAQRYLRANADRIIEERKRLGETLARLRGVRVFPSQANFILVDFKGTGKTAAEVEQGLSRGFDLFVRPLPPNPKFVPPHIALKHEFLRVTIGTRAQNDQLINALREIVFG